MRPFGAWFGRLAMAGTCLLVVGCGGGDIPDPDSDSHAATEQQQRRGPAPRSDAAPEPEPKAEEIVLASNTPPPKVEEPAAKPDEKPAEPAPAASKGDASGTDELLKMSGGASPAPGGSVSPAPAGGSAPGLAVPGRPGSATGSPSGGSSPAPSADPAPGSQPGPSPRDRRPGQSLPGLTIPAPGQGGPAPAPGGPSLAPSGAGGTTPLDSPSGGRPGGPPGGPGGPGAITPGGGQDSALLQGTKAFNSPNTAVMAFLAALKAKNKERLAQCTALHAPTEAAEKHRKIFAAIVDQSISDDELDEMAKSLENFQYSGFMPATSSGRMSVLISKMEGSKDRIQRTVITRKEKEGWKVLDVEKAFDFNIIRMPTRGRRR